MASAPAIDPGDSTKLSALDDFYVPAYLLTLNGKVNPKVVRDIVSVTFHDSLKDVDSVELQVNNWDPGEPSTGTGQAQQGKFRYHNDHIFDPWQSLELSMGYYRRGKPAFKQMMVGEISSMSPTFPATSGSTLTVRALSFMHQFRIKQKTLQFKGKTDSQIAQMIVKDINKDVQAKVANIKIEMTDEEVKNNIDTNKEKVQAFVEMHNQYPIMFLRQRSKDTGYNIWIDDKTDQKNDGTFFRTVTFHYQLSNSVLGPMYVLVWGKSLISFQPTLQTARQVSEVTVNGWDVHTKKPISKTVTRVDLIKNGQNMIAPADLGVIDSLLSQKTEVVVDRGLKNEQDINQVALKTLRQLAQNLVEAKGKTIGLPNLRAGCKVQICMNPLDVTPNPDMDRFSGIYLVTETTHTFNDGGYTTDFSCRMESKTLSEKQQG